VSLPPPPDFGAASWPSGGPSGGPGSPLSSGPPATASAGPVVTRREALVALLTVVGLVVLGVLLGVLWAKISPDRPRGLVIDAGIIPDETESFVASDGRFAILTAIAGVLAALVLWSRPAWRGPAALIGLAVGGALGALATDGIGRWLGGGSTGGPVDTTIDALPLQVHAVVLLGVETMFAMLCYGVLALFSTRDDLGNPVGAPRPVETDSSAGVGQLG
jgi:Protein of unknown function (DUF2567)